MPNANGADPKTQGPGGGEPKIEAPHPLVVEIAKIERAIRTEGHTVGVIHFGVGIARCPGPECGGNGRGRMNICRMKKRS